MLRTPLCDLLGISVPIVLAPFGPWDQVDLAAAVCESGALGSLGTAIRSPAEMRVSAAWKQRITEAGALDAVKVQNAERVMPPFNLPQLGLPFAPRALRTPLIETLEYDPGTVDPAVAGPELLAAVRAGGGEDHLPFAGQSVELIHEVRPAREVVRRLVDEAEAALRAGARLAR